MEWDGMGWETSRTESLQHRIGHDRKIDTNMATTLQYFQFQFQVQLPSRASSSPRSRDSSPSFPSIPPAFVHTLVPHPASSHVWAAGRQSNEVCGSRLPCRGISSYYTKLDHKSKHHSRLSPRNTFRLILCNRIDSSDLGRILQFRAHARKNLFTSL